MALLVQSRLSLGRVVSWTKPVYRQLGMERQVLGILESKTDPSVRCYTGGSDFCRLGTWIIHV